MNVRSWISWYGITQTLTSKFNQQCSKIELFLVVAGPLLVEGLNSSWTSAWQQKHKKHRWTHVLRILNAFTLRRTTHVKLSWWNHPHTSKPANTNETAMSQVFFSSPKRQMPNIGIYRPNRPKAIWHLPTQYSLVWLAKPSVCHTELDLSSPKQIFSCIPSERENPWCWKRDASLCWPWETCSSPGFVAEEQWGHVSTHLLPKRQSA